MQADKDLDRIKALLVILIIAVTGLGYYAYKTSQTDPDIKIEISEDGISID